MSKVKYLPQCMTRAHSLGYGYLHVDVAASNMDDECIKGNAKAFPMTCMTYMSTVMG
jgi:hypothetical protein